MRGALGMSASGGAGACRGARWEEQELTFTAARTFANPYTDVVVWARGDVIARCRAQR